MKEFIDLVCVCLDTFVAKDDLGFKKHCELLGFPYSIENAYVYYLPFTFLYLRKMFNKE